MTPFGFCIDVSKATQTLNEFIAAKPHLREYRTANWIVTCTTRMRPASSSRPLTKKDHKVVDDLMILACRFVRNRIGCRGRRRIDVGALAIWNRDPLPLMST